MRFLNASGAMVVDGERLVVCVGRHGHRFRCLLHEEAAAWSGLSFKSGRPRFGRFVVVMDSTVVLVRMVMRRSTLSAGSPFADEGSAGFFEGEVTPDDVTSSASWSRRK
jgi:hypothetical protein